MARRTVLQMDQTASTNSQLLRPQSECGALPNLVGHLRLPHGRDYKETAEN